MAETVCCSRRALTAICVAAYAQQRETESARARERETDRQTERERDHSRGRLDTSEMSRLISLHRRRAPSGSLHRLATFCVACADLLAFGVWDERPFGTSPAPSTASESNALPPCEERGRAPANLSLLTRTRLSRVRGSGRGRVPVIIKAYSAGPRFTCRSRVDCIPRSKDLLW